MSILDFAALRGVLFDVDGTLVDTNYLHTTCWAEALRQYGHVVPMARIHRAIGMGGQRLVEKVLSGSSEDLEGILSAHAALMATHWPSLVPLPGAVDLLTRTSAAGLKVVLASSASERDLQALLAALGNPEAVDVTTHAADVEHTKPDPELLQLALDRAGLRPADAVFVGDSVWDIHAADDAKMPAIGLLSGGTSEAELRNAGAVEVYDDPSGLLAAAIEQ